MCTRRRNGARSHEPAEILDFLLYSHKRKQLSSILKVLLIEGAEICSLGYMHGAGLSDRRRWKEAALSEWQEHYQSIFHRCHWGTLFRPLGVIY